MDITDHQNVTNIVSNNYLANNLIAASYKFEHTNHVVSPNLMYSDPNYAAGYPSHPSHPEPPYLLKPSIFADSYAKYATNQSVTPLFNHNQSRVMNPHPASDHSNPLINPYQNPSNHGYGDIKSVIKGSGEEINERLMQRMDWQFKAEFNDPNYLHNLVETEESRRISSAKARLSVKTEAMISSNSGNGLSGTAAAANYHMSGAAYHLANHFSDSAANADYVSGTCAKLVPNASAAANRDSPGSVAAYGYASGSANHLSHSANKGSGSPNQGLEAAKHGSGSRNPLSNNKIDNNSRSNNNNNPKNGAHFTNHQTAATAAASSSSSSLHTNKSKPKKRKSPHKQVFCVPATGGPDKPTGECVPQDSYTWRKYGQKPIKGSPYPRSYYRCSSVKGCTARKQVERNPSDPLMIIIKYTYEHNHIMKSSNQASSKPLGNTGDSNDAQILEIDADMQLAENYKKESNKDPLISGEDATYDQISEGSCERNSSLENNANFNENDDDDVEDDGAHLKDKDKFVNTNQYHMINKVAIASCDQISEGIREPNRSSSKDTNLAEGANTNASLRANMPHSTKAHNSFLYNSVGSRSFTEILLRKSSDDDDEEEDYNHVYGELNDWISLEANASHSVDPFNLFQWS